MVLESISTEGFKSIKGSWSLRDDIIVSNLVKRGHLPQSAGAELCVLGNMWKRAMRTQAVICRSHRRPCPVAADLQLQQQRYRILPQDTCFTDGGQTWADTLVGARIMDRLWEINCDHHIRHVFQARDGSLIRNYCHTIDGEMDEGPLLAYMTNPSKCRHFPFTHCQNGRHHPKFFSFRKSLMAERNLEEICPPDPKMSLFLSATHQLRNGSIVATGALGWSWTDFSAN